MEKKLIVYYSYTNNTKKIAEQIQKAAGADICEIETVKPYTGDYDSVVDQGKHETERGYKPAIKSLTLNPADYDTIILGTPVWWYTYAPAVGTFLSEYDLSGKTIILFATNGGWIGHTFKDIKNSCAGADVKMEKNIRFNDAVLLTPEKEIQTWIQGI